MKKYIVGLAIIALVLSIHTPKAEALSCLADSFSVEYQRDHAAAIFAGKVTNIKVIDPDSFMPQGLVTFEVSKYWKGDIGKTITVASSLKAWSAQNDFYTVGNEYLVYANAVPENDIAKTVSGNLLAIVDCGRTGPLVSAQADIAVLGEGKVPGQTTPPQPPISHTYTRNLTIGSRGADVISLQTFLESQGLLVMPQGVAKGYFGILTRAALARYQASVGISPAVGFFGPITRAKIK